MRVRVIVWMLGTALLGAMPTWAASRAPTPASAAASAVPPSPSPATPAAACKDEGSAGSGRVRTLVLDWKTGETAADTRSTWGRLVAAEAERVPGLEVLTAADLRAALSLEADKQLLGCDEGTSCLAEIAEALDATLVVEGQLARAPDGAALVALTLLNAHAVVVVNRVALTWRGDAGALPDVVRAGAQLLLLDKSQRPPGSILVRGLPADAQVFLDDVDVTARAAQGALEGIDVGPHALRVRAPGKLPATLSVLVMSGQRAVALPVLEDEPAGLGWLLLGGAGAVAVSVGATLGVLWALSREEAVVEGRLEPWKLEVAAGDTSTPDMGTATVSSGSTP